MQLFHLRSHRGDPGVRSRGSLTLEKGEDALTDYQFGEKRIHHVFCSTCGVRSPARGTGPDGKAMCAVNVRCLEDVDPAMLKTKQLDGRSM